MKQFVNVTPNGVGTIVNNTRDFQVVRELGRAVPDYLFFDNAKLPATLVKAGMLILDGCSPNAPLGGIKIPFNQIAAASAVQLDCYEATKQKVRLECFKENCSNVFNVGVSISRAFSNEFPVSTPPKVYNVTNTCTGDELNCLGLLTKLVAMINADVEATHVATLITDGVDPNQVYSLQLEAKEFGVYYTITGSENFMEPSVLVQPLPEMFKSSYWQGIAPNSCVDISGTKCYRVIFFKFNDLVQSDGHYLGGSNLALTENHKLVAEKTVMFAFDKSVPAQLTEAARLLTALDAGANAWLSKVNTEASKTIKPFKFCVRRTDAGNGAAFTTFTTDYPAFATDTVRTLYISGVSYYTLSSSTSTAPTPVGGDVVVLGDCGPDDAPCLNCE